MYYLRAVGVTLKVLAARDRRRSRMRMVNADEVPSTSTHVLEGVEDTARIGFILDGAGGCIDKRIALGHTPFEITGG
jgi:hypothetical protein